MCIGYHKLNGIKIQCCLVLTKLGKCGMLFLLMFVIPNDY